MPGGHDEHRLGSLDRDPSTAGRAGVEACLVGKDARLRETRVALAGRAFEPEDDG